MKNFLSRLFGQSADDAGTGRKSNSKKKAPEARLGSDEDPVRQGLFASQPLRIFLKHVELDSRQGPYRALAATANLLDTGRQVEAIDRLKSILKTKDLSTPLILWIWTFLREQGVRPDARAALEILGVVFEMPSSESSLEDKIQGGPGGQNYDTLAAYADGTARFLSASGHCVSWDKGDDVTFKRLCQLFIESTLAASHQAQPRLDLTLPMVGPQITLLTRSGIFAFKASIQCHYSNGRSLDYGIDEAGGGRKAKLDRLRLMAMDRVCLRKTDEKVRCCT